jgi:hypothetical protein
VQTQRKYSRDVGSSNGAPRRRHSLEGPPTTLAQRFFPFGFPVDVQTNSTTVLELLDSMWRPFTARFNKEPILCEIVVAPSSDLACPPEPRYHIQLPLLTTICDGDNFSIADLETGGIRTHMTEAALHFPLFVSHFLLPTAYSCICTLHATPVHAACVSWKKSGVLLAGDSGAGKSTLAYACAKSGWTFTSDDASFVMNDAMDRRVIGNNHQVRLRPESASNFPEISQLKMTPRAAGKPSVEIPTSTLPRIETASTANVEYIVYLNRNHTGPAILAPSSRELALESMIKSLYGVPRTLAMQYAALDRLLTAPIYEMRYNTLSDGIALLRKLVEEGADAGHIIAIG